MLRRLKNNVRSSKAASTNESQAQAIEQPDGFLCPMCMITLATPDLLQQHYSETHEKKERSNSDKSLDDVDSSDVAERFSESGSEDGHGTCDDVTDGGHRASVTSTVSTGAFTCPQCFCELASAELLQSHYTSLHEMSENRDGDVLAMRLEMNDLRASVNEEKWYSTELKKELEKLQAQLMKASQDPLVQGGNEEFAYMQQQIQALEAGKALVTSRMLELEKDNSELKRSVEAGHRDKERIIEKSAKLAKDVVQLKSELDEAQEQKMHVGDELLKLKETISHLVKQLDQRPSEDDVDVLRKELIHAQTLMDTVNREKEQEMDEWKRLHENLAIKCSENEKTVQVLQDQLNSTPKSEDMFKLQSSIESSSNIQKQELELRNEEIKVCKEELSQIENENKNNLEKLAESNSQLTSAVAKLHLSEQAETNLISEAKVFEEKLKQLTDDNLKINAQLEQVKEDYDQLRKNSSSTDKKAFEDLQEKEKLVFSLKSELEKKEDAIKVYMTENEELKNELSLIKQTCDKQSIAYSEVNKKLALSQSDLNELKNDVSKRGEQIAQLLSDKQHFQDSVERLKHERDDMLGKIQDGEGSVAIALKQLNAEKELMQKQMKESELCNAQVISKLEAEITKLQEDLLLEKHSKSLMENEKDSLQNSFSQGEKTVSNLKSKVEKLEAELKTKKERLSDCEKSGEDQRLELEGHLQSLRESLKDRSEQTFAVTKQIEHLKEDLSSKKEQIARMEVMLADEKQQLATAIDKLNVAQKKAEQFADTLDNTNQIKQELEWKLQEAEKKLAEMSDRAQKSNTESDKWEVKEMAWNALRAELEGEIKAGAVQLESAQMSIEQLQQTQLKNAEEIENLEKRSQNLVQDYELKERAFREKFESDSEKYKQLENNFNAIREELAQTKTKFENLQSNFDLLNTDKSEMECKIEALEAEILVLNSDKSDKKRQSDDLNENLNAQTNEITELNARLSEVQTALEKKIVGENEAREEVLNLKNTIHSSNKENEHFVQEIATVREQLDEKQKSVVELSNSNSILKSNLEKEMKSVEELNRTEAELQQQLSLKNDKIEELICTQVRLEKKLSEMVEMEQNLNERLSQQQEELSIQAINWKKEKDTLLDEMDCKEKVVAQNVKELKNFKEASITLKVDMQERLQEVQAQLESERKSREALESEKCRCVKELNKQIQSLTENMGEVRQELNNATEKVNQLNTEKQVWDTSKEDLQSQINAWSEEKRALLDKCNSSEKELERLIETKDFLQRKYDDLMAAVHDLGRSNQSLQIDMSKHIGKQWVDDSQAINCNHCGKDFSLTVRKHHCRKCGYIFCNECTLKKASLASSKNPVRVCDECYDIAGNTS